jgi:uncharacterized membrane protein
MRWFLNKTRCILIEILGIIINIVNAFLTNIVVYEVTGEFSFDWGLLLSNKLFWIVILVQFTYGIITICAHIKNTDSDKRLVRKIETGEIALYRQAVEHAKDGDYVLAQEAIKLIDEFEERRKRNHGENNG